MMATKLMGVYISCKWTIIYLECLLVSIPGMRLHSGFVEGHAIQVLMLAGSGKQLVVATKHPY